MQGVHIFGFFVSPVFVLFPVFFCFLGFFLCGRFCVKNPRNAKVTRVARGGSRAKAHPHEDPYVGESPPLYRGSDTHP